METYEARWFKVELGRATAPWAYKRGEPFRVIAALELLGTLLSIKVLMQDATAGTAAGAAAGTAAKAFGRISAGASTDNQGNRFILNKLMTTKFPLLAFVCEMASELEARNCLLDLGWVPRDQNQEADAITNNNLAEFCEDNELKVDLDKLEFKVLRELLELGDSFYAAREKQVAEEKTAAEVVTQAAKWGAKAEGQWRSKRKHYRLGVW